MNTKTNRRNFIKQASLAGVGLTILNKSIANTNYFETTFSEAFFKLPPLPYAYDALEPYIDKQTMEIHYTKHHQAYVNNLNKALIDNKITETSIDAICKNISKYPVAVRNNGGGHYNHSLFWTIMKPNGGSVLSPSSINEPTGKLADAIKSSFDSFDNFKILFSGIGTKIFGSGWAWLVKNKEGKLEIGSTQNQDNPLMDISELKGHPIVGLDVWEHAYYLKYQNKRPEYITNWWNIINWNEASKRFES